MLPNIKQSPKMWIFVSTPIAAPLWTAGLLAASPSTTKACEKTTPFGGGHISPRIPSTKSALSISTRYYRLANYPLFDSTPNRSQPIRLPDIPNGYKDFSLSLENAPPEMRMAKSPAGRNNIVNPGISTGISTERFVPSSGDD